MIPRRSGNRRVIARINWRNPSAPAVAQPLLCALKPVDSETGMEDFTDQWVLSRIVKRYSDFVSYPIVCRFEREEIERDRSGNLGEGVQPAFVIEDKTLNSMKPIWSRAQTQISESEYADGKPEHLRNSKPRRLTEGTRSSYCCHLLMVDKIVSQQVSNKCKEVKNELVRS